MRSRPRASMPGATALQRGSAVAVLAASVLFGWTPPAFSQESSPTRIAYVDMKRLIDDSPQVRDARQRLQREFDASLALLREDERRIADIEARLTASTGDEANRLRSELDPLRRSVERTRERLRNELEARSEQEVQRAWPVLNEAISNYARANGLDLVISSGAVYVSGRVDITDRVLDLLEREQREEPER